MESINIKMKSVDTMEDKIFKKIREIGLVSTDISTVVEDCHALAIAICVGNTSLIYGALAYLRSGVGFKNNPTNTPQKWHELYDWANEQFPEE